MEDGATVVTGLLAGLDEVGAIEVDTTTGDNAGDGIGVGVLAGVAIATGVAWAVAPYLQTVITVVLPSKTPLGEVCAQ